MRSLLERTFFIFKVWGGTITMKDIDIFQNSQFVFGKNTELLNDFGFGAGDSSAGTKVCFWTNIKELDMCYTSPEHINCKTGFGVSIMKGILYRIKNTQGRIIKKGVCLNRNLTIEQNHTILRLDAAQTLLCEFFLPHMVTVNQMHIYTDDEASITPYEHSGKKIFFLGGINTLGAGCTFQNTTMPFTVSETVGAQAFNFSEYSHNFYNLDGLKAISEQKPDYVVCELFSAGTDFEYMKNNIAAYVERVVEQSKASRVIFWGFPRNCTSLSLNKKHQLFREIKSLYANNSNAIFLCCDDLFKGISDDEYAISLYFINDYANYILAQKIIEIIKNWE